MLNAMQNQLGQATTALAFLLNFIMGEGINAILTIIISLLSIIYLVLKIVKEIRGYKYKDKKE